MAITGFFAAALACLAIAAVFVSAESAFATVSRSEVADAVEDGRRGARKVLKVFGDPLVHTYVLTFTRQLAEASATVFIAFAYLQVFDVGWEAVVCTVITASVAVFVVAGVSPRTVARHYPLQTSPCCWADWSPDSARRWAPSHWSWCGSATCSRRPG